MKYMFEWGERIKKCDDCPFCITVSPIMFVFCALHIMPMKYSDKDMKQGWCPLIEVKE